MSSPTSGSQHYQDYRDYPMVVKGDERQQEVKHILEQCSTHYKFLVDHGMKPEEARQVLPNACSVNFMWTINARSLMEFLRQRLCKRNVEEMQIFAKKLHELCVEWFPELFVHVGPQCKMLGKCKQGPMKADVCKKTEQ